MAHKETADMVWKDGGSSRTAFGKFLGEAHAGPGASTPLNY